MYYIAYGFKIKKMNQPICIKYTLYEFIWLWKCKDSKMQQKFRFAFPSLPHLEGCWLEGCLFSTSKQQKKCLVTLSRNKQVL